MNALPWVPWHRVVQVRPDLLSGDLPLAVFAADLNDVVTGAARPAYRDPAEFFAFTYPTINMRDLARDIAYRLAGLIDKAIRQLELTYGGGKTHTLITLYHLFNDPAQLPDLPAVHEFVQHIGIAIPQARIVVLPFDKLDVEKGMEVHSPTGEVRWLKQPWSVLAFQLAGSSGLRLLHPDDLDQERESAPAEPLLKTLLGLPAQEGLATLILIDEVLMYAREKVNFEPVWRDRLINFFQYLTQAATKVDRCAIVASLLATDPTKSDSVGKEITRELYNVFRREKEESIQPVLKEDVAEVLRRRLFTPGSIRDREAFRRHVVAALKGIGEVDEQTRRDGRSAEERFLNSYPFHPDLTEVFYTKWTGLESFQRTRGVLRTFALALRNACQWDASPLVGVNVFLNAEGQAGLSEAARELATTASMEETEGKRQAWSNILEGELQKGAEIQREFLGLRYREVEQAVLAVFLHSQPIDQKAFTRDLMVLLGSTHPDRIELEKSLLRWTEVSWFLDEDAFINMASGEDGTRQLPKSWKLGLQPNLRQMHDAACKDKVPADLADEELLTAIGQVKALTEGARPAGAVPHMLPKSPADVKDDGQFHFAVLGPDAASSTERPSALAQRYIEETTGPDRPRVYRNAIVLLTPSVDGLELARRRVVEHLGWQVVAEDLKKLGEEKQQAGTTRKDAYDGLGDQQTMRWRILELERGKAQRRIEPAVRQAYNVVVTVSERNDVIAFRIKQEDVPSFQTIKADRRARIQDTAVSAEALLPGGPYDLWRDDEQARRVRDLVGAFAQNWALPKMLDSRAILQTLVNGCREGAFVMRITRSDRSVRTFWYETPDEVALQEPSLEVVLPGFAVLSELIPDLLEPDRLPQLWYGSKLTLQQLFDYFAGNRVVEQVHDTHTEPVSIPKAEPAVVKQAVRAAVATGKLWLVAGPASVWREEPASGLLTPQAELRTAPVPLAATGLLPEALADAWESNETTALALAVQLSNQQGNNLPWRLVRNAIHTALDYRLLELVPGSGPWPCDYAGAQQVKLRQPAQVAGTPSDGHPLSNVRSDEYTARLWRAEAELDIHEIQELADRIHDLKLATMGQTLRFRVIIELDTKGLPSADSIDAVNHALSEIHEGWELAR